MQQRTVARNVSESGRRWSARPLRNSGGARWEGKGPHPSHQKRKRAPEGSPRARARSEVGNAKGPIERIRNASERRRAAREAGRERAARWGTRRGPIRAHQKRKRAPEGSPRSGPRARSEVGNAKGPHPSASETQASAGGQPAKRAASAQREGGEARKGPQPGAHQKRKRAPEGSPRSGPRARREGGEGKGAPPERIRNASERRRAAREAGRERAARWGTRRGPTERSNNWRRRDLHPGPKIHPRRNLRCVSASEVSPLT